MTGEVVRTTAGDLDAASLGVVDSHDHLFLSTPALPGQELTDFGAAVLEADLFREAGGTTIVQWTPRGLGRQLAALQNSGMRLESTSSPRPAGTAGRSIGPGIHCSTPVPSNSRRPSSTT